MLVDLSISNYALAGNLELEFGPGLNVLTGETGAGKSIVVGALSALIGGRISGTDVREGKDQARLAASFDFDEQSPVASILQEADLGDDGVLVVSRDIAAAGRSRCRINGHLVTVSALAEVGGALVDIHGQHEHQSLLRPGSHLLLLDAMGDDELVALKEEVTQLFDRRKDLLDHIRRIQKDERDRERQEDLLRYQIDEISAAALEPDEDVTIEKEWTRLAHAERLASAAHAAYEALYAGDDRRPGATEMIAEAVVALETMQSLDVELEAFVEGVQSALANLEDTARELRQYGEALAPDARRLAELEERREHLAALKRKYGDTLADVEAFLVRCQDELAALTDSAETLEKLRKEEVVVSARLAKAAEALSAARQKTAEKMSRQISDRLALLNMPAARFEVHLGVQHDAEGLKVGRETVRITRQGIDTIEFLFSANPGESPRPLARIASGGEMSRVMLAIKASMALAEGPSTLVFDEVDAGLGGQTAERVADALAELAAKHQVIVVTHLAQIAVRADRHKVVEKVDDGDRTLIDVRPVDGDARVEEIARMLDGLTTETSKDHARALLQRANPSPLP